MSDLMMDVFVNGERYVRRDALEELVIAAEDMWRRWAAGDGLAPHSSALAATYRQACAALGRQPDRRLLDRLLDREWSP